MLGLRMPQDQLQTKMPTIFFQLKGQIHCMFILHRPTLPWPWKKWHPLQKQMTFQPLIRGGTGEATSIAAYQESTNSGLAIFLASHTPL